MADISEYIEQIENAVYGEEVRSSIVNSLQAINDEVNKEAYSVTLAAEDWEEDEDGYLVQEIENENVTADSTVLVAMQTVPTGLNLEAAANYSNIYHATVHDGGIKFYILEAAGADVPIDYVLISSKAGKVFLTGSGVGGGGGELILRSINIIKLPTKLSYRRGESISTAGMVVKARYNSGSVIDVTAQCVLSTSTAQATIGTQTITVSYTEDETTATASFDITVYALDSISIDTPPQKLIYYVGDNILTNGMVVIANYGDGSTANITNFCTISPQTAPANVVTQNITVSYTEDGLTEVDTYTVTVYELDATVIIQTLPGSAITVVGSRTGAEYSGTADENGTYTIEVHYAEDYVIQSELGNLSGTATVAVDDETATYNVQIDMKPEWKAVLLTYASGNNPNIWKTSDGITFEAMGRSGYSYSYSDQKSLLYMSNNLLIHPRYYSNNSTGRPSYEYSFDGGETWQYISISGTSAGTFRKLKKIGNYYYLIGVHQSSSSSIPNHNYYWRFNDLTNPGVTSGSVTLKDSSSDGEFVDYDSNGVFFRALTTRYVGTRNAYTALGSDGLNIGLGLGLLYANNVWVLAGTTGIAYSIDGDTWNVASLPTSLIGNTTQDIYFKYIDSFFYYADVYGIVMKSADGITWTIVNDTQITPSGLRAFIAIGSEQIFALYQNNEFYARVYNGSSFSSPVVVNSLTGQNIADIGMLEY